MRQNPSDPSAEYYATLVTHERARQERCKSEPVRPPVPPLVPYELDERSLGEMPSATRLRKAKAARLSVVSNSMHLILSETAVLGREDLAEAREMHPRAIFGFRGLLCPQQGQSSPASGVLRSGGRFEAPCGLLGSPWAGLGSTRARRGGSVKDGRQEGALRLLVRPNAHQRHRLHDP